MNLPEIINAISELDARDCPALLAAIAAKLAQTRRTQPAVTDSDSNLLLVEQAAQLLRLQPSYVYELVRSKKLAAFKTGKYVRIPHAAVTRFISENLDTPLNSLLSRNCDTRAAQARAPTSRPKTNRIRGAPRCAPVDGVALGTRQERHPDSDDETD